MLFHELTDSPEHLRGVGPKRAARLAKWGVSTVADLLSLVPRRYEDRSRTVSLVEAVESGEGVVHATVVSHEYFLRGRQRTLKLIIQDETSTAALVCFGRNFLARTFPEGSELSVYGQFSLRYGEIQASVFDAERRDPESSQSPQAAPPIVPVYPLTEGITQAHLRDAIAHALNRYAHDVEDEIPTRLRHAEQLPSLAEALQSIHFPATLDEPEHAYRRFVWGELFTFQLRLAQDAQHRRRHTRRARPAPFRSAMEPVIHALPFQLTEDQSRVLSEILSDMDQPWPMSRLLQGDVGSGKTLVAVLAALSAVERGQQAALMVPTELLARQHARNVGSFLAETDVRPALVLGSMPAPARREVAAALGDGELDLLIGTHALFSQGLVYANLGLVIIDEQHRFGVGQRERLQQRGLAPDVLMMSATPIPRSLALTAFGDSEVSTIHRLPPGRKPIKTHLARMGNEQRVYQFVRRELDAGRQAYLVYPAIAEGGPGGYRSAQEMHRHLQAVLAPYRVGIAHSRMEEDARAETMAAFARCEIHALVATSVVEVGVDVPNATCMVIEHAEVFGLAALHQLRGRVGRGAAQSYCILVYQEPLSSDARERLKVMYESTDGFFIAEEDLRIRGPGELQGSRQSGFLEFRFADIRRHMAEMISARTHVARVLREDPELQQDEHQVLNRAVAALREES
ncbi:MAG TPA: ATP-dependent DNA helicase RecG, partial [Alkalispirochaeta sp.]|nr:ATP-dependent DNA helicase RecG [Alkalispirochaeta sp.]